MLRGAEHPGENVLARHVRGQLSAAAREQVQAHLKSCESCRAAFKAHQRANEPTVPTDVSPLFGELTTGSSVGEYKVLERIGRGGMGVVFRGEHAVLGRQVAIKVLSREVAGDAEAAARMFDEARAASAVRHPNIVEVYDAGTLPDGRPYLVMEYLEGTALFDLSITLGRFTSEQTLGVLDQALAALEAAHAAGVVHRDLKPENIFLRAQGSGWKLKLLDFGLALRSGADSERLTRPGFVVGTPLYMSPEQTKGDETTPKSDVYALGAVAWGMLTGRALFDAKSLYEIMESHRKTEPPRIRSIAPEVDPGLEALVMQMLAKDPAQRPSTQEARRRIAALAGPRTSVAPALEPRRALRPVLLVLAAMGAVFLAALSVALDEPAPAPVVLRPPPPRLEPVAPAPAVQLAPVPVADPAPIVAPPVPSPAPPEPERFIGDQWACADITRIGDIYKSLQGPTLVFEVTLGHDRPLLIASSYSQVSRQDAEQLATELRKKVVACKGSKKTAITASESSNHPMWGTVKGPIYGPGTLLMLDHVTVEPLAVRPKR